ncbi:MAG TPA: nuclear transport factor 2 family protein [Fimbriimonadaceae bacterium]|nr:nuclear transport factor 2 family protein [Fimbriimonadaceae bacterium]
MTRTLFPLLLIFALSASVSAQTSSAKVGTDGIILKRTNQWVDTWNQRDVKRMRALHAEDIESQFYAIGGNFSTVEKLLKDIESTNFFGLKWAIKIADPHIRTLSSNSALIVFRLIGKETNSKGATRDFSECFTLVFQRIRQDWKIVHVHDSSRL